MGSLCLHNPIQTAATIVARNMRGNLLNLMRLMLCYLLAFFKVRKILRESSQILLDYATKVYARIFLLFQFLLLDIFEAILFCFGRRLASPQSSSIKVKPSFSFCLVPGRTKIFPYEMLGRNQSFFH